MGSIQLKSVRKAFGAVGVINGVDLSHMPDLKGRTATVLKDSALELVDMDVQARAHTLA